LIDISEQKTIYNNIYATVINYNCYDDIKNEYVDAFAKIITGKILDAGCGKGIHLKRLLRKGYDVFGIEISEVCCENFLKDTPHENTDIINYSKKEDKYDGLICMDVLEHIDPLQIEETIQALAGLAPIAFFGIANHSDVLNGIELHLITEDSSWWVNLLAKYYKRCYVVSELAYTANTKIFSIIYCDNNEEKEPHLLLLKYIKSQFENTLINYFKNVDQNVIDSLYKSVDISKAEINITKQELEISQQELNKTQQQLISTQQALADAMKIVNHPLVKMQISFWRFIKVRWSGFFRQPGAGYKC
jgi:SAM-dependent methyltransferase